MLLGVSIVYVIILIFCVLMLCAKVMYTRSNTRTIMLLWDFKNKHSCNVRDSFSTCNLFLCELKIPHHITITGNLFTQPFKYKEILLSPEVLYLILTSYN